MRVFTITALILIAVVSTVVGQANIPISESPDDIYWSTDFQSPWLFDQWPMNAIDTVGTSIVFAGYFKSGGSAVSKQIVGWDVSNWHGYGGGLSGLIYCITGFQDKVTVGGRVISQADGDEYGSIAQWDGVQWAIIPGDFHGTLYDMLEWRGKLWVAGDFDSLDGVPCADIACWDGSQWTVPKIGETNQASQITNLTEYKHDLILSGTFDSIGGIACRRIASWDEVEVRPLGSGITGTIRTVFPDGVDLFVGGAFDTAGGVACKNIAKWNGSSWQSLGDGANNLVTCFGGWQGGLAVGGGFDSIGGIAARRIAYLKDSNWSPLGGGMPGAPMKLVGRHDSLIACGIFSGTHPMYQHHIEVWSGGKWDTLRGAGADAPSWHYTPSVTLSL